MNSLCLEKYLSKQPQSDILVPAIQPLAQHELAVASHHHQVATAFAALV